ncbi:MAG: hypothetical protein WB622_17555 [Acidobacteriaceae bacterium]
MAHFASEGDAVPMLCPDCCTLDDIPDWPHDSTEDLKVIAACNRCGFTFPILPGEFRGLTLHALHNHRCKGPDDGNWATVGKKIIARLGELQHDPDKFGEFINAAFQVPQNDWGYEDDKDERARLGIRPATPAGPTGELPL